MTVQDIEILKQKCNAVMIALCPGQCQCKFIQCINVKPFGGRGSPLRWESLQHSPRLHSWWGGAGCLLPMNLATTLGPSGLNIGPLGHTNF